MRIAYFDCIGGISGDMTLGAVLDAGADADRLLEGLRSLALPPWELEIGKTRKSGIAATTVEVVVGGEAAGAAPLIRLPPADAPLSGSGPAHEHQHEHAPVHAHAHAHVDAHEHAHSHGHVDADHAGTRHFCGSGRTYPIEYASGGGTKPGGSGLPPPGGCRGGGAWRHAGDGPLPRGRRGQQHRGRGGGRVRAAPPRRGARPLLAAADGPGLRPLCSRPDAGSAARHGGAAEGMSAASGGRRG